MTKPSWWKEKPGRRRRRRRRQPATAPRSEVFGRRAARGMRSLVAVVVAVLFQFSLPEPPCSAAAAVGPRERGRRGALRRAAKERKKKRGDDKERGGDDRSRQFREETYDSLNRIINGDDVEDQSRYPWMVDLGCCAGTLIAPDIVMTAAHCGQCINRRARIGRYNKADGDEEYEEIKIASTTVHPGFVPPGTDDIAICLLEKQSSHTPVPLNTQPFSADDDGLEFTVIGWGTTESGVAAQTLQQAVVMYDYDCGKFRDWGYVTPDLICAADHSVPRKDACNGDSGGPLIVDNGDGALDLQVGILSFGENFPCNEEGKPAVYTRVSAMYGWIKTQVCSMTRADESNFDCDGNDFALYTGGDNNLSNNLSIPGGGGLGGGGLYQGQAIPGGVDDNKNGMENTGGANKKEKKKKNKKKKNK